MCASLSVSQRFPSRSKSMLCASGNKPSPQVFWSSPSRLKIRTGGSEALNTKIDPLPSAATDRGRFHTFCPLGGAPKNVTSYLRFVVWANAPATNVNTAKIIQTYFFIGTPAGFFGACASIQTDCPSKQILQRELQDPLIQGIANLAKLG